MYEELCQVLLKISPVRDYQSITQLIQEKKGGVILSFVNAHAMNLAAVDVNFRTKLLRSDFLLVDGIGMKILFNRIKLTYGINMNGTDYIPYLLERFKNKNMALYGSTTEVIKNVESYLSHHTVVDSYHGFEDFDFYIQRIQETKPELILLGMGMPKQEILSILIKEKISHHVLIVNGGAIVDFLGEKVTRAPDIFLKLNMEWIYRLMKEPRRLFKRYVIGNFIFLWRIRHLQKIFQEHVMDTNGMD